MADIAKKKNSTFPLSKQIYLQIKKLILQGVLAAGTKVHASRALAKELGVARSTVLEAYEQLLAEGYLEARHGSGTRVAQGIVMIDACSNQTRTSYLPYTRAEVPPPQDNTIQFRSGIPDLGLFPRKEWFRAYQQVCNNKPASLYNYCDPAGVWELRTAIAAYLLRVRGVRVSPQQVMITTGTTQGLRIIAELLQKNGDRVISENPAHLGMVQVIERAGYTLKAIPVDAHGLNTTLLPDTTEKSDAQIAFLYTTPSHQYPLGGVMPIQRRQSMIDFAKASGAYIIEDDYDSEFRYEAEPISALYELSPEIVIYLGSFSKILAPALRLGFTLIPQSLVEAWRQEKQHMDYHTDAISQHALAVFINSGSLERHTWKMKKYYKQKRAFLIQMLDHHFSGKYTLHGHAAGLHLVVGFPNILFDTQLLEGLKMQGLTVHSVDQYSLDNKKKYAHKIILGYSHLTKEEIALGISILKKILGL